MNDDNYVEWLVKRKDPAYAVPVKILMIVVCIFSVLLALQTVFGVIVMTIAGVATYFVFLNLSVEFEYLFAEGGLSVDRILGRAKRKKIWQSMIFLPYLMKSVLNVAINTGDFKKCKEKKENI